VKRKVGKTMKMEGKMI